MKRIACVVLFALLTASISGVNDAAVARAEQNVQTDQARRQEIAARLKRIPINSVIRIEQTDGMRFDAILQDVTSDAITVTILEGQSRRPATVPIDQISDVERLGGHTLRNVLIAAGIGAALLVGACAAALNNAEGSTPNLSR
jgi:hypothetical protein